MADYDIYLENLMIQCQKSVLHSAGWTAHGPAISLSQRPQQRAPRHQTNLRWYHGRPWGLEKHAMHQGRPSIGAIMPSSAPQQSTRSQELGRPSKTPDYPPNLTRAPVSNESRSQRIPVASSEADLDTRTSGAQLAGAEGSASIKTEDIETGLVDKTIPEVQPLRPKLRERGRNLGVDEHEVLLQCCLKNQKFYTSGTLMRFWHIVQLDFELETGRQYTSARQTILRLVEKRRMEQAQNDQHGRIQYPHVQAKIRQLLDDWQKVMDNGAARGTTERLPTAVSASASCTESPMSPSRDVSTFDRSYSMDTMQTPRKRSIAKMFDDTDVVGTTAQRPRKRRVIAERPVDPEDDSSDTSSDSNSGVVSETFEDTDSQCSAPDENDNGNEDIGETSNEECCQDSSEESSDSCGERARPRVKMRQRREFDAELAELRLLVTRSVESTSKYAGERHDSKLRWNTRRVMVRVAISLAACAGLMYVEKRAGYHNKRRTQGTKRLIESIRGLLEKEKASHVIRND